MPLLPAVLTDDLTALFNGADLTDPVHSGFPPDENDAGQIWAAIYGAYAAGALAGATTPLSPSLAGAESALTSALAGAFTAAKGGAPLAPLLDAAFSAFWMAPPIAFASPPPPAPATIAGVVTVATPTAGALVQGALTAGLAPGANAASQAAAIATALDTWTRTVMVVNTPLSPPGPPLPPVPLA